MPGSETLDIYSKLATKADVLDGATRAMLSAFASEPRLRILELLSTQLLIMSEIAAALDIPLATTVMPLDMFGQVGSIRRSPKP